MGSTLLSFSLSPISHSLIRSIGSRLLLWEFGVMHPRNYASIPFGEFSVGVQNSTYVYASRAYTLYEFHPLFYLFPIAIVCTHLSPEQHVPRSLPIVLGFFAGYPIYTMIWNGWQMLSYGMLGCYLARLSPRDGILTQPSKSSVICWSCPFLNNHNCRECWLRSSTMENISQSGTTILSGIFPFLMWTTCHYILQIIKIIKSAMQSLQSDWWLSEIWP